MRRILWALAAFGGLAMGHVGSPDIFLEGSAGPYPVFVTIRPPAVIPGTAEVEIRVRQPDLSGVTVRIVPTPIAGPGARFAPTPDVAERSSSDPQFFSGNLWMMTSGSWQVKVMVDGPLGRGELAIPVPALANRTETMNRGLGAVLGILTLILVAGAISIAGAASREAQLNPGEEPTPVHRRRARLTMAAAAVLVAGVIYLGNNWWTAEANSYSRIIYKPLEMKPALEANETLRLTLADPGWLPRKTDDFVPDHNHLMHMYVVRLPRMERVWHLHPEMTGSGVFTHQLPPMPAGRYALYADVVHENGLPETMVAEIDLPSIQGKPLAGDDSGGAGSPIEEAKTDNRVFLLPGGGKMIWERDLDVYPVKKAHLFRFRMETADGRPASDLELYMGMPGHAAFLKRDRSVFAHVHPTGSVPMAALNIAQKTKDDPHAGHAMHQTLPPEVSFPYGFPQPGDYRIFVQVKRAGAVETGVFDVHVQ